MGTPRRTAQRPDAECSVAAAEPAARRGRLRVAVAGVVVLLAMLLLVPPLLVRAQEAGDEGASGAPAGWFTDAQAERGRGSYLEHCAECHSRDLQARSTYISLYQYPALTGSWFMDRWEGESVRTLFQVVRHTMPLDDPGSLDQQEYADIVAYILQANDFPAGDTELPPERENPDRLGGFVMESGAKVARAQPQDPAPVDLEEAARMPAQEGEPTEEAQDPAEDGPPAVGDDGPWYTEAQAMRGDESFVQHCARCHGRALQGVGVAPSLAGGNFIARWEGETVAELFRIASTLMPLDGPAELDQQTYADLVAYILFSNNFEAGDVELPPDFQRLEDFVIRSELADVPDVP